MAATGPATRRAVDAADLGVSMTVYIERAAHEVIAREAAAQVRDGKETGGYLWGRCVQEPDGSWTYRITRATGPHAKDERTPGYFRDSWEHWAERGPQIGSEDPEVGCVGEWHSHPPGYPNPSQGDFHAWRWMVGYLKDSWPYDVYGWLGGLAVVKPTGSLERLRVFVVRGGHAEAEVAVV